MAKRKWEDSRECVVAPSRRSKQQRGALLVCGVQALVCRLVIVGSTDIKMVAPVEAQAQLSAKDESMLQFVVDAWNNRECFDSDTQLPDHVLECFPWMQEHSEEEAKISSCSPASRTPSS